MRRLPYMPALSAIRCNPDLHRKYEALRERGDPPKVAIAATMCNLIILANLPIRQDSLWLVSPDSSRT